MQLFKIILKFAYFFAAVPGFDLQTWRIKKSLWHSCYSIATAVLNIIIAIVCICYDPKLNFRTSLPTGVCLYYARYISFSAQLVMVNLSPVLHYRS